MLLFLIVPILLIGSFFPLYMIQFPAWEASDDEKSDSPLFLTPLLKRGEYLEAQQFSKVTPDIGNVTSYSGFFTVNEECDSNLFFWFFPAQKNEWVKAPVVLWLQGGPGRSSFYGIFEEIGPFKFENNSLKERRHSWNIENNLLIIDQPVGVGYSFTDEDCYRESSMDVAIDLYEAVIQFYDLFPEVRRNKFIITGQSYGGHYVPALGYTIHKNSPSAKFKINLSAMLIGNGWMDPATQIDYASYLYQLGIIDDEERNILKNYQGQFLRHVSVQDWGGGRTVMQAIHSKLSYFVVSLHNYIAKSPKKNWPEFILSPEIRKALHVGNIYFNGDFNAYVYKNLYNDSVQSVKPWVEELLEHYPIIFYNGQLDIICAYPMMINFLRSLKWSGQGEYLNATRHKWCVRKDLAGYFKGTNNLYDVLVRAAGHSVPIDQSLWVYELANSVTSGAPNDPLHALNDC